MNNTLPLVHLWLQRKLHGSHGRKELCSYCNRHPSLHSADDSRHQLPACLQSQWCHTHWYLWSCHWRSDFVSTSKHKANHELATPWWSSSSTCTSWRRAARWRLRLSLSSLPQASMRKGKPSSHYLVNESSQSRNRKTDNHIGTIDLDLTSSHQSSPA